MNRKTRKRVVEMFRERLVAYGFTEDQRYSMSEGVIYKLTVCDSLNVFMSLVMQDTFEGFCIELAASQNGDYPFHQMPNGVPYNGQYRHSLAELAKKPRDALGREFGWELAKTLSFGKMFKQLEQLEIGITPNMPKVSEEKIVTTIDDAMASFREFGVPYLEKIASEKGLQIQWKSADSR